MMKSFIPVLIGMLVIGGAFAVQHMLLQRAESSIALLEKDLAAARKEAAAWKLTADQARAGPVWTVRRPLRPTRISGGPSWMQCRPAR